MGLLTDIQCVVLDFDGTLTDVHAEAAGFLDGYRADIAALVPLPAVEFDHAWAQAEYTIRAAPDHHGWRHFDGVTTRIIAPAHTDPYIMPGCIAHLVLDTHRVLRDLTERATLLSAIFARHYQRTTTHFRPHTAPLLHMLISRGIPIHIVTNSHTDAVTQKLQLLDVQPDHPRIRLHGNARKNVVIDPTQTQQSPYIAMNTLREPIRVANLDRHVWRNRGHYFDILHTIWRLSGASPATTLVCGDLYELDLALPQALGTHIRLVTRASTAPYEIAAVQAYVRGSHGESLLE